MSIPSKMVRIFGLEQQNN